MGISHNVATAAAKPVFSFIVVHSNATVDSAHSTLAGARAACAVLTGKGYESVSVQQTISDPFDYKNRGESNDQCLRRLKSTYNHDFLYSLPTAAGEAFVKYTTEELQAMRDETDLSKKDCIAYFRRAFKTTGQRVRGTTEDDECSESCGPDSDSNSTNALRAQFQSASIDDKPLVNNFPETSGEDEAAQGSEYSSDTQGLSPLGPSTSSDRYVYEDPSGKVHYTTISAEQNVKTRYNDFIFTFADLENKHIKTLAEVFLCLDLPNALTNLQASRVPAKQRESLVLYAGPERAMADAPIFPIVEKPSYIINLENKKGFALQDMLVFITGHQRFGITTLRKIIWNQGGIVVDQMSSKVSFVIIGHFVSVTFVKTLVNYSTPLTDEEHFGLGLWTCVSEGFDYLSFASEHKTISEQLRSTISAKEAKARQIEENPSRAPDRSLGGRLDMRDLKKSLAAAESMMIEVEKAERARKQEFIFMTAMRAKVAELVQQEQISNQNKVFEKICAFELQEGIDFETRRREKEEEEAELERLAKERREMNRLARNRKRNMALTRTMEEKRLAIQQKNKKERLAERQEYRELRARDTRARMLAGEIAQDKAHEVWAQNSVDIHHKVIYPTSLKTSLQFLSLRYVDDEIEQTQEEITQYKHNLRKHQELNPHYEDDYAQDRIKILSQQLDMLLARKIVQDAYRKTGDLGKVDSDSPSAPRIRSIESTAKRAREDEADDDAYGARVHKALKSKRDQMAIEAKAAQNINEV